MFRMSPKVLVVFVVCVLAALVTIEVVFWIFGVPATIRHWILGGCTVALALYFLIDYIAHRRLS